VVGVAEVLTSVLDDFWSGELYVSVVTAVIFFSYTCLKMYVNGWLFFYGKLWHKAEFIFTTAHLGITLYCFLWFGINQRKESIRFGALPNLLLPPILVCNSRTLRHTVSVVTNVVVDTLSSLCYMLWLLLLFSYLGCILFENTFVYDVATEPPQDRYDTLGHGFIATFVLLTTENYPSIEIQPWKAAWSNIFYFMAGVFASVVLQAYVLGKVDDAFTHNLMKSVRYHYAKELRGYAFAFLAITTMDSGAENPLEEGWDISSLSISPSQWRSLVQRFSRGSDAQANLLADVTFFFRDEDASGDIDLKVHVYSRIIITSV